MGGWKNLWTDGNRGWMNGLKDRWIQINEWRTKIVWMID